MWIYIVYNIPNWLLLVLLLMMFSHPQKRFDPNNNWGDMACCIYPGNAYTSIPMLLAELKCILLTAKEKEIDQKHQNGGSMDGIYVNSAVFIFRGGHPYSMGVILKNACDSIAKSVVGEWKGAVPFVKLSLSWDGGCGRTVATICLSQLRKTKKTET